MDWVMDWVTDWSNIMLIGAVVALALAVLVDRRGGGWSLAERGGRGTDQCLGGWLHDVVMPELQLLRMRANGATFDAVQLRAELDLIEHRLRMRQLDDDLAAGRARVIDVVQPYIRMAQRVGCRVVEVPDHEAGLCPLDASTGQELRRFLAVVVPNALTAGASTIGFDVRMIDMSVSFAIAVRDDAGGFVTDDPTHLGRGRDRLAGELGAHRLTTEIAGGGTTVTCRFAGRHRNSATATRLRTGS